MSLMSISELSGLTGFTRETVAKRLTDIPYTPGSKAAKLYESQTALPVLYESPQRGDQVDLMYERALLAKSQRTKIDIEIDLLLRKIIPAETVEAVWSQMTSAARQRLLAVPYRMASAALAADSFQAIETAAADLIREALNELHHYDPADYQPAVASTSRDDPGLDVPAAAASDGQPVGGSVPPPQQRSKRRTRTVAH